MLKFQLENIYLKLTRFSFCTIWLAFFITFLSCEYTLDESYVNPIEIPDDISPKVRLLLLEEDPFYLTEALRLTPDIELIGSTEFEAMEVRVNGSVLKGLNEYSSFDLNPSNYDNGIHLLEVTIISSTSSGSLASAVDTEFISTTYSWNFIIDKIPPAAIGLTASIQDGQLLLEWDKPEKQNFSYFEIEYDGSFGRIRLNDLNQTSIIEDAYVGGYESYRINLVSDFFKVNGIELNVNYDPFENYDVGLNEDESVEATWTAPVFYNNVTRMEFEWSNNSSITYDVSNLDTYIVPKNSRTFGFGRYHTLYFNILGSDKARFRKHYFQGNRIIKKIAKGKSYPEFWDIKYNSHLNSYYIRNKVNPEGHATGTEYIHRLNESFEVVASYPVEDKGYQPWEVLDFEISENGELFYLVHQSILYQFDPSSMEVINTIDLTSIIPEATSSSYFRNISISNDNFINLELSGSSGTYLINMNNLETEFIEDAMSGHISSNHRYYLHSTFSSTFYRAFLNTFTAGGLNITNTFSLNYYRGGLILDSQDILVLFENSRMLTWDINSNNMISETNLNYPSTFSYDPTSDVISVQDASSYYIIDYLSGGIVKKIEAVADRYVTYNGNVFASTGYVIDVQDL